MQSGLYVASGLLEGLSLGDLCRVVGTDPNDVGAEEDQDVSAHLKHRRGGGQEVRLCSGNTEIPAGTGSYSSEQEVLLELYIILVTSFQVHNASHLYILQEDQEETGFICV